MSQASRDAGQGDSNAHTGFLTPVSNQRDQVPGEAAAHGLEQEGAQVTLSIFRAR